MPMHTQGTLVRRDHLNVAIIDTCPLGAVVSYRNRGVYYDCVVMPWRTVRNWMARGVTFTVETG